MVFSCRRELARYDGGMVKTPKSLALCCVSLGAVCWLFGYWMGTPKAPLLDESVQVYTKDDPQSSVWSIRVVSDLGENDRQIDTVILLNKESDGIAYLNQTVSGGDTGIRLTDDVLSGWRLVSMDAPR